MKKRATEYYKEKLEERRRILFPLTILKSEKLNKLDDLLDKRNEFGLKGFWENIENIEGIDALRFLSEQLKDRGKLSEDDINLIKNIVKDYNKYNPSFNVSGSVGVFMQIDNISVELAKKELPNALKIPLFFWLYLTIIESAINDLTEMFLEIAGKKNDQKFIDEFDKSLDKGEHLLFGKLKEYAIAWGYTTEDKKTFLHKSNLRNEIAHANIWYDESRNKILLRGRMELSIDDFLKEFERIYDFFKELLFQLNSCETDLTKGAEELTRKLAKEFHKIIRSGPKRKIWQNEIKFEWEKEEKDQDSTKSSHT